MKIRLSLRLLVLLPLLILAEPALGEGWRVTTELQNDFFVGDDRHFTNGFYVRGVSGEADVGKIALFFSHLLPGADRRDEGLRWGLGLGQEMYTPKDYDARYLVEDDRPYAGWLFVEFSLYRESIPGRRLAHQDRMEIELGVVGSSAGADELQDGLHALGGSPKFRGWKHQLDDEPGIVLRGARRWRYPAEPLRLGSMEIDFVPHLRLELGNVSTLANTGAIARFGGRLPQDFGRGLLGRGDHRFAGYFWFGVEGSAVARNIFLDGNTFRNSHDVSKEVLVASFPIGVSFQFWRVRMLFSYLLSTKEFKDQSSNDTIGRISFGYDF